jgi:hypothetical protein
MTVTKHLAPVTEMSFTLNIIPGAIVHDTWNLIPQAQVLVDLLADPLIPHRKTVPNTGRDESRIRRGRGHVHKIFPFWGRESFRVLK